MAKANYLDKTIVAKVKGEWRNNDNLYIEYHDGDGALNDIINYKPLSFFFSHLRYGSKVNITVIIEADGDRTVKRKQTRYSREMLGKLLTAEERAEIERLEQEREDLWEPIDIGIDGE